MSELSVKEPGFHHLWLCFIPLNYSLTLLPLHRLPFRTQRPSVKVKPSQTFITFGVLHAFEETKTYKQQLLHAFILFSVNDEQEGVSANVNNSR